MKRELSHIFRIKIIGASLPGATADGFATLSSAVPIDYEEEAKESTQGVSYKQSVEIFLDRADCPAFFARQTHFHAIVKLNDCINEYTWGSIHVPVKVMVTPHFERLLLAMSCESSHSIISY